MKTQAQQTAEELVQYFSTVRQVGHTSIMLTGVTDDSVIITHNKQWADNLGSKTDATCIPLYCIPNGRLRGTSKPLVLDNAATLVLLNDLLADIAHLKEENAKHRMTIEMVKKIVSE